MSPVKKPKRGRGRPPGSPNKGPMTEAEAYGRRLVRAGENPNAAAREALTRYGGGDSAAIKAAISRLETVIQADSFKGAVPIDNSDFRPHFGPWFPQEPPDDDMDDGDVDYIWASEVFGLAPVLVRAYPGKRNGPGVLHAVEGVKAALSKGDKQVATLAQKLRRYQKDLQAECKARNETNREGE